MFIMDKITLLGVLFFFIVSYFVIRLCVKDECNKGR